MIDCSLCDEDAETKKGVIYMRGEVIIMERHKWKSLPVCKDCYDRCHGKWEKN